MKLKTITFDRTPRIPGLRPGDLTTLSCENPPEALRDWRLSLRGTSAFLISPPGWVAGRSRREWDHKGPTTAFEVPRTNMYFEWSAADAADLEAILKGGRYDSEPFTAPVPVQQPESLLAKVPSHEVGDA